MRFSFAYKRRKGANLRYALFTLIDTTTNKPTECMGAAPVLRNAYNRRISQSWPSGMSAVDALPATQLGDK
jgi:hypothetical protein